jgi:hypothetical protein
LFLGIDACNYLYVNEDSHTHGHRYINAYPVGLSLQVQKTLLFYSSFFLILVPIWISHHLRLSDYYVFLVNSTPYWRNAVPIYLYNLSCIGQIIKAGQMNKILALYITLDSDYLIKLYHILSNMIRRKEGKHEQMDIQPKCIWKINFLALKHTK